MKANRLILFILMLVSLQATAQNPVRSKWVRVNNTIAIDSLSLVFGSVMLFDAQQRAIAPTDFEVDHPKSELRFKTLPATDSLHLYYSVLPYNFSAPYPVSKSAMAIQKSVQNLGLPDAEPALYDGDSAAGFGLQTNGLISRGMVVGNNQNLVTVSNLNMQITGQLSQGLFIEALLSDKNIPLQPDGYTQQIQDFDQVYIKIYDSLRYIKMGDVPLQHADGYFMRFNRKIQGADMGVQSQQNGRTTSFLKAGGAVAKGTYHRLNFTGIEGVMGPYQLTGANNEQYIVVLAGSERVYIDGTLLQRGEQADYVMNYNTAELTFMSGIVITQNSRITVEFEYSDRNYNRYLAYANTGITRKNSSLRTAFFSETDAKNQPVDQPLTDVEKMVLTNAGNEPLKAIVPNYDSAIFDKNYVMYQLIDTLVDGVLYDSVFVHSINPNKAVYQVGFAYVGENRGHYQPEQGATNGRSYKWMAPVGRVLQGSYEPVKLLVAPKKHQMLVVEAKHKMGNTATGIEWAVTQTDSNTFSNLGNEQNIGMALKADILQTLRSGQKAMSLGGSYQFLTEQFNAFDRFREVEFNRNWNLPANLKGQQHLATAQFLYKSRRIKQFGLSSSMLVSPQTYEGFKQDANLSAKLFKTSIMGMASLLNSSTTAINTTFYKYQVNWVVPNRYFSTTLRSEFEQNRHRNPLTDSLIATSKKYLLGEVLLSNPDTLSRNLNVSAQYRTDYLPEQNRFKTYTTAWQSGINAGFTTKRGQMLRARASYRNLHYNAIEGMEGQRDEQNFLARADYRVRLLRKTSTFNAFYEVGTGLETRREFMYVEVPAGQGLYVWNDYNQNGVPELNEFEVAPIPEEANYIRIMTPTSDYMKVYTAQINLTLVTNLAKVWANAGGAKKFWSKWQNSFSYRALQKHTNPDWSARLNPFAPQGIDTNHITSGTTVRNTLSFNRTSPKFGADWVYTSNQQKTLLSYGFDENKVLQNQLNIRWNITNWLLATNVADVGAKEYNSEYFASKNYYIESFGNRTEFQVQPGVKFRTSLFYALKSKSNLQTNAEEAQIHEAGTELKFSAPQKGNVGLRFSTIYAQLTGENGTSVAYELLEGNQPGVNYRWNVNVARNLNKFLKLTLYYSGRKMPGFAVIHTGQLNLSAFF